jgi:predicted Zn-ribbon and HTH transcriptional regulator
MELKEFEKAVETLKDFYGEKSYQPKTFSVIWQIVKSLSLSEFDRVLNMVIEDNTYKAPTPGAIRKAAYPFLAVAREREYRKKLDELELAGKKCRACEHSGFIYALSKKNCLHEYAFRCPHCVAEKVRNHSYKILMWSDDFKTDFAPVSCRPESFNAASNLILKTANENFRRENPTRVRQTPSVDFAALAQKIIRQGAGDLGGQIEIGE